MTPIGEVYLVGAGPGDPGLLTLRGLACLQRADVVIYDRLANPGLLAYAPTSAELIDAGKETDRHALSQTQINALLVEEATAGKIVVRLKGGDPFIFGRGGEEALALVEAGVPFEVVPGVSSAVAAAAYAGIPLTHRELAASIAIVTGHRSDEKPADNSRPQADTLVFLMAVANLPQIAAGLVAAGRSADTPAAVVEQGTLPAQRTLTGTLADIAALAATAGIRPPAVLIVGDVVRLRQRLRWFDLAERRPLLGWRVLNTRPRHEAAELSRRLAGLGADPVELPATEIAPPADWAPLENALRRLIARSPAYDWLIFTSANAVTYTLDRVLALGADGRALAGVRLAAVGSATARALQRYGLGADFIPVRFTGHELAVGLGDVEGRRALVPRSDIAPPALLDALAQRGMQVESVVAYTVRPASPAPAALTALLDGQVDAALFASPSGLAGIAAMLGSRPLAEVLAQVCVACIGPGAADAARDLGVRVDIVADEPTVEGLVTALVAWKRRL